MREFVGGVRTALRRWPVIVGLAVMMGLASVVMAVLFTDVLVQASALQGGAALRRLHPTVFSVYYGTSAVSEITPATLGTAIDWIDDGRGYTMILNNVRVDDPGFAQGLETVVVSGELFTKVYPALEVCAPAPCAMRGAHLSGRDLDPVTLGGYTMTPDRSLPAGAAIFDPNAAGLPVDDVILVNLPASALTSLDDMEREEAAGRLVTVGVPDEEIARYSAAAGAAGLYLVPQDVAEVQPKRYSQIMIMSSLYVVGLTAFLGLVVAAFALAARQVMAEEQRAFTIRRMYGAGDAMVWARVGGYLATVLLALPCPLLALLLLLGPPVATGALAMLGVVGVLFVAMLAGTVRSAGAVDRSAAREDPRMRGAMSPRAEHSATTRAARPGGTSGPGDTREVER